MCWNEPVSWTTFIVGTIVNIVCASLTSAKHRLWFVLFQSIITVQLGEALIWHEPDGSIGNIGTYIVFFSIWLQPIIGMAIMANYGISTPIFYIACALLLIYVLSSIESFKHLSTNNYTPELCNGDTHHIIFNDTGNMGYFYAAICVLLLIVLFPQFPYVSGYIGAAFILSQMFYKQSYASMWCWFSVASPAVFYLTRDLPTLTSWDQIAKIIMK